jgi:predicted Fe-Mo cluster-binding NifX family protein
LQYLARMRRVAIAVWRGCVSTTLDFAGRLLILDVEGRKEAARKEVCLESASPQATALRLEELGVSTVVCGAISRWLAHNLEMRGIRVIPFVSGKAEDVIQAFAKGTLGDRRFLMAGCQPGARKAWRCRRKRGNPRWT